MLKEDGKEVIFEFLAHGRKRPQTQNVTKIQNNWNIFVTEMW
jgi:hypothetical protein